MVIPKRRLKNELAEDYPPDVEFAAQRDNPHVYGEFVWTGFDYLGEPDPWGKTSRSSYFGIFDLAGFPKDRYWLYRSVWRPDVPTAHILPHWNWKKGTVLPVPPSGFAKVFFAKNDG